MDVTPKEETYSVEEAKQRLRRVSAQFDPLAFIKRKAAARCGHGFSGGLGLGSLRCRTAVAGMLPLAMQAWDLAVRLGLAAKPR